MRKLLIIIFLLCITLFSLSGTENPWAVALSGYKPLYILSGIGEDQVKIRLSFKFDFFYPHKIGLYLGYSQLMFWDLYELSAPFKDIDYNLDFFWRFQSGHNFADDMTIPFIDYIQLGLWEHTSNGMPRPEDSEAEHYSRGMDRIYFQFQTRVGSTIEFGLNFKYFHVFFVTQKDEPHDNPDIQEYIGSFVCKPFIIWNNQKLNDYLELYAEFAAGGGQNGLDFDKGFLEVGFKSYKILSRFRLYAQYYQGYCESMLNYNHAAENTIIEDDGQETTWPFSFRVGLILE